MINSVYIHIPFCSSICSYCDFCKMFYNEKLVDQYLIALEKEVKEKYKGETIKTLYIGGGTPSSLSINQLKRLLEIIKLFKFNNDIEFTIEVNVSDISYEMLSLFKNNNVNRLSIGIETVNESFMPFLNRYNSKDLVKEKVETVKKYFDNFNLDLMYAFPNETVDDVINDLSFVVSLEPKHISIYSLIIEEHTKLFIGKIKPIDQEIDSLMYNNIIEYLKNNNYIHYEISNFAKKGFESKHNLVYWNNERYYGFGLGASGYINNIRYTNTRNIKKFNEFSFGNDTLEVSKGIDMENELILGLRKIEGISKEKFIKKFHSDVYEIFDIINLIENNLLVDDGTNLYIPEDKLYVSNSILINFLGGSNE